MTLKLILRLIVWAAVATVACVHCVRQGGFESTGRGFEVLVFFILFVIFEIVFSAFHERLPRHFKIGFHVILIVLKVGLAFAAACEMNQVDITSEALRIKAEAQISGFKDLKAHVLNDIREEMIVCWQSSMSMRRTPTCEAYAKKKKEVENLGVAELPGDLAGRADAVRNIHAAAISILTNYPCAHAVGGPPDIPLDLSSLNGKSGSIELLLLALRTSSIWPQLLLTMCAIFSPDFLLLLLDLLRKLSSTPESERVVTTVPMPSLVHESYFGPKSPTRRRLNPSSWKIWRGRFSGSKP